MKKLENRIALLLPYFGKLPPYFQLWLNTGERNASYIDYILITDQNMNAYTIPQNVNVINTSFEQIRERVKEKFDFPISLEEPYKLCDFKPAYGEIFSDLLRNYGFWGFCDPDIIWGDISKYINESFLTGRYDKIGCLGHLQILKNNIKVNKTYRYNDGNMMRNYKVVFSSPYSFAFDEQYSFEILAQKNKLKVANLLDKEITPFADIDPFTYSFKRNYGDLDEINFKYFYYSKETGLKEVNYLNNGKVIESDCMYLHLQKRNMKVDPGNGKYTLIYPNVIRSNNSLLSYENIKDISRRVKRENLRYRAESKMKLYLRVPYPSYISHMIKFKKFIKQNRKD